MDQSKPALVITGASGFVGRHLLDVLTSSYRIYGIARRSQSRSGAPEHPNISWFQADIGERPQIAAAFEAIARERGVETVLHLAAHYDFTGDEHPEYMRTNVGGLRNVLDLCKQYGARHFIFSSSVAACRIPRPGGVLTEDSPPDGDHIYARTKGLGEAMLREYNDSFPWTTVRFAALFSDWCEYPPLFMFLSTWLSFAWNSHVLGGKGKSAIPYMHVRDLVTFMQRLLERKGAFAGQTLVASPDGCTSHEDLFHAATLNFFGSRHKPIHMPRLICGPGMYMRDLAGIFLGERPFERPWMARYIDTQMAIDSSRTRERLGWAPRPRLEIIRRMPFLVENLKSDPHEWNRRNRAAMKEVLVPANLKIVWLIEKHEDEIQRAFHDLLTSQEHESRFSSYHNVSDDDHDWNHRVILRHLMNAVRTRDRGVLAAYSRDLAERRFEQGFKPEELCGALEALNLVVFRVLRRDPASNGMRQDIQDYVTSALRFACDQVQETWDQQTGPHQHRERYRPLVADGPDAPDDAAARR